MLGIFDDKIRKISKKNMLFLSSKILMLPVTCLGLNYVPVVLDKTERCSRNDKGSYLYRKTNKTGMFATDEATLFALLCAVSRGGVECKTLPEHKQRKRWRQRVDGGQWKGGSLERRRIGVQKGGKVFSGFFFWQKENTFNWEKEMKEETRSSTSSKELTFFSLVAADHTKWTRHRKSLENIILQCSFLGFIESEKHLYVWIFEWGEMVGMWVGFICVMEKKGMK